VPTGDALTDPMGQSSPRRPGWPGIPIHFATESGEASPLLAGLLELAFQVRFHARDGDGPSQGVEPTCSHEASRHPGFQPKLAPDEGLDTRAAVKNSGR
jgi:hypothetical protein